MKLKCLIVDDDKMSRMALQKCAESVDYLEIVDQCEDALQAIKVLDKHSIDLIFLDIEMPNLSGLDFVKTFKNIPQIIFVSAKTEYAVDAFENDVTDYLVKPVALPRFMQAAEKAKRISENLVSQPDQLDYIFFKTDTRLVKINLSDIQYIEAFGDYIKIYTDGSRVTVLSTMKAIETKLGDKDFMRIHKSYIVRIDKISQVDGNMVMIEKKSIPVSRTYKDALLNRLNTI